jgi:hypothetical protein
MIAPISFGARGFVCEDGSIIGWSILDGMHRDYHVANGTTDADFVTRWRKWTENSNLEIDDGVTLQEAEAIQAWLALHADEEIEMPNPRKERQL